jgi:APA family basic amino acid/polyamine antiporter
MSRDGLLPPAFSRVHPRFKTPYVTTILTGCVAAVIAGLFPIGLLGELVSIGTLFAFVVVCAGVWYLRVKEPERSRPFRTPLVPLVPILGIGICGYMMVSLPSDTWLRLITWMVIGMVVYFLYSRHHSVLRRTGITVPDEVPPESTYTEYRGE